VAAAKALTDADVPVVVNTITDGRDVAPSSAKDMAEFLADLPGSGKGCDRD
jgi:2,3-bisphosphoglycerate-independent phosphoglycerate mutase